MITKPNRFDSQRRHRRSIRLKGYDYTSPGGYFITICTYQRECLFGEVVDREMVTNELGEIVQHTWDDLPNHYRYMILDQFFIMPNHVHGIIILSDSPNDYWGGFEMDHANRRRGGSEMDPTDRCKGGSQTRPYAPSLCSFRCSFSELL